MKKKITVTMVIVSINELNEKDIEDLAGKSNEEMAEEIAKDMDEENLTVTVVVEDVDES